MTDETIDRLTAALNRLADALVQATKEEKGKIPRTPLKGKEETNNNNNTPARARFVKPTVEEVAVPPDHRLNVRPCSPAECPRFAAKEGGAA